MEKELDSICENCESESAKVFCYSCMKLHFYCQNCFDFAHKSDAKKSHKNEPFESFTSNPDSKAAILYCPAHKELRKYACLACNKAICVDCSIVGEHVGHKAGTFQKGHEKLVAEFKTNLPTYESFLQSTDTTSILKNLTIAIGNVKTIKEKTEANFKESIEKLIKKKDEVISVIDKELAKYMQDKNIVEKNMFELKTLVDKCKGELDKSAAAKCMEYVNLSKDIEKTKDLKQTLDSLLPISKLRYRPYFALALNDLNCLIESTKVTFETFGGDLKKIFDKSGIIKDDQDRMLLMNWVLEANKYSKIDLNLLWKGTVDGFGAATFHSKCDNKGSTLTVILSDKNRVFGGYTTQTWGGCEGNKNDANAFIFSLTYKDKYAKQKCTSHSINCYPSYGPIFGWGYDICIYDNSNNVNGGYSYGNYTYQLPSDVDSKTHLAGSCEFAVKEIEVYSVTFL